jgi:hypothetical protein
MEGGGGLPGGGTPPSKHVTRNGAGPNGTSEPTPNQHAV